MNRIKFMMKTTVMLGILVLGCGLTQAQVERTWVSGVGDDAFPCSRVAPCKTFTGAIGKTLAGGQINVIDAGSYGTVKITKSITIDASESFASILASNGADGVIVAAGPSDVVTLRGLTITGAETGGNGIKFESGDRLQVEDCRIFGFTGRGIDFEPDDGLQILVVKDSIIRENDAAGILIQAGPSGSAKVTIDHTRLEGNLNGLSVVDGAKVTIRNSVAAGNSANGVLALASKTGNEVSIENCLIANNGDKGIKASGSGGDKARVRLSGSTVTTNDIGLFVGVDGHIGSFSNNNIAGNITTDGAPDYQILQQ